MYRSRAIRRDHRAFASATAGLLLAAGGGCTHDWSRYRAPRAGVFLASDGSDTNACTASAPCRSFERGYRAAQPGQTVEIAAGSYPMQTIPSVPGRGTNGVVVFRPAADAAVTVAGIEVRGASKLSFERLTLGPAGWQTRVGSTDVTFRDVTVVGGGFRVLSSTRVLVVGGSYGDGERSGCEVSTDDGQTPSRDIVIDGVDFHDWHWIGETDPISCLRIYSAQGAVVRNSRFRRCGQTDLFVDRAGELALPTDIVIEGNFFGTPRGIDETQAWPYALQFNDNYAWSHVTVRYNSATQAMVFGMAGTDFRVVGNIAASDQGSCVPQVTYRYNVWSRGAACDPSHGDRTGDPLFVDPETLDLHLRPGSAAIGAGDPSGEFPPRDIDGDPRPQGALEAGADELAM